MSKNLRTNMIIKKYNMVYLQLINNVTSIQVEFGLSIVQIYVDEHFKKLKRFPFQSFNELVLMLFDH